MTAYLFVSRKIDTQKYPWGYPSREKVAEAMPYGVVYLAPSIKSATTLKASYAGSIKSQTTNS